MYWILQTTVLFKPTVIFVILLESPGFVILPTVTLSSIPQTTVTAEILDPNYRNLQDPAFFRKAETTVVHGSNSNH